MKTARATAQRVATECFILYIVRQSSKSVVGEQGLGTRDSGLGTRDSGLGTGDSGLGTRDSGRLDSGLGLSNLCFLRSGCGACASSVESGEMVVCGVRGRGQMFAYRVPNTPQMFAS